MLANVRVGNGQELRPNLVALPASEFAMSTNIATGVTRLRFAAISWNNGKGPMEIEAGATSIAGQDVYQKVYNSDGTFTYYDEIDEATEPIASTKQRESLEAYFRKAR